MKTAYKNRFTRAMSVLLAAVMLFGYLVIPGTVRAEEEPFRIESSRISDGMISFYQNEKPVITVSGYPVGAKFQWQIAMPGDEGWVDIMGQEEASLTLSYALVTQILDESGMTSVRCKSTCNGANDFTPPVDVKVIPGMAEPEIPAPTDAPTEPAEETTAPTDAPTEPAEETTAPTDAPTEPVEETTAPTETPTEPAEETTAPTEAPTEPVVETTAPTDAPTEPVEETTAPTDAPTEPVEETTAPTEPAAVVHEVDPGAITGQTSNADGDDENIVTITIQYIYWDRFTNAPGEMVWNPYSARIKKGEDLHDIIDNRTRPGYKAELASIDIGNAAGDTSTVVLGKYTDSQGVETGVTYVKLDLYNVTDDLTFTVYYKEVEVPYAVRYYLQNVSNDMYTEDNSLYKVFYGFQNAQPSDAAVKKEIEGFTTLFYQPDAIAADGSTVFEVYYDRNYYLVNFDLDEGYGTAPVYARFGTQINVATPEKTGYTFAGWKLIEEDGETVTGEPTIPDIPAKVEAHNRKYQAQWTSIDTTYTVAYWREKVDGTGYEYWGSETHGAKSGTEVSAETHKNIPESIAVYHDDAANYDVDERLFFTFNPDVSDTNVTIDGDGSTVVNVKFDRNTYTLKFYYAITRYLNDTNTPDYYYVIGGSTHYFGKPGTTKTEYVNEDDEIDLLTYYNSTQRAQLGTIKDFSEKDPADITDLLRSDAPAYTTGYDIKNDVTYTQEGKQYTHDYQYHYISFTAKYGENIKDMWPCDVFHSATRENATNSNGWDGDQAFVSAWNGEYNVWYSHHGAGGNPTIKGKYEKLDYRILWEGKNPDDMTVTYLCFWENGTKISWNVPELWFYRQWVPTLTGESTTGLTTKEVDGVTYKLVDQYPTCDNSSDGEQTQVTLEGFSTAYRVHLDSGIGENDYRRRTPTSDALPETYPVLLNYYEKWLEDSFKIDYTPDMVQEYLKENFMRFNVVDFYYDRIIYELSYQNHNEVLTDKTKNVPYQTVLDSSYNFTPDYPDGLEPDAYTFQGWYTSPYFEESSRFTFSSVVNDPMPASDLKLYAKWEPVEYDVYFYTTYADYKAEAGKTHAERSKYADYISDATHGEVLKSGTYEPIPTHPTNPYDPVSNPRGYRFVNWFYIKDGQKVAFEPSKMEITQDMELYAEWTSSVATQYSVHYETADGTEIAPSTTGYAFVSTTKTFFAKQGPEDALWLPHTNSHSILMDEDPANNEFTFIYEKKNEIKYTIRYVDITTGDDLLLEENKVETQHSILTPQFKYIPNYVPDAFYKRLVLSVNESENVLTFYYTPVKEDEGAYYVAHMIQNLDSKGDLIDDSYSVYFEETRYGKIGDTVTETSMSIPGYTPADPNNTSATGEITRGDNNDALELILYYTPLAYNYKVQYLDSATNQPVYKTYISETEHYFGSTVSADAVTVNGYDLAGDETTKELVIGAVKDRNVITFYYVKKPVVINYKVTSTELPGSACGELERNLETPQDYTTDLKGTTAEPNAGFRFLGWYYDEACTKPVLLAAGTEFTPNTEEIEKGTKENIYEFTYYARFEPITLTITKKGEGIDSNDTFLFRVKGTDTDVDITVSIQGAVSVTLAPIPVDTYTVTELTGWSWTYSPVGNAVKQVDLTTEEKLDYTVDFTNEVKHTDWLHAETYIENPFDHQADEKPEDATEAATESKT